MKARIFLFIFIFFNALQLNAQPVETLLLDAKHLFDFKQSLKDDKKKQEQLKELISKADKLLNMKPVSVMDKKLTPASGNKQNTRVNVEQ